MAVLRPRPRTVSQRPWHCDTPSARDAGFTFSVSAPLECRSGDPFLQFGAGLADFRRYLGTALNLKENALGFLAVARRGFLHLLGHGERIASHVLALLDALDQLRAHGLDFFRGGFVLA